ncbi:hypothetical protein [Actinoplanes sp. URMC 104]|uniref:hypothetical protein n=1 Tax=Actinoplanes sp. URMC 104 TaxID=3423409 RepID=UPI003F1C88EE
MASRATSMWRTTVGATYRMFGVHDPTCAESDAAVAVAAASREVVGWAPHAVMVEVVTDLVPIEVRIDVLGAAPAADDDADLVRDGVLATPGGMISLPESVDETVRLGVELPAGPGTYAVRVCGYGRVRARRLWDEATGGDLAEYEEMVRALAGTERYRLLLWHLSPEPRWTGDDEDE